MTLQNAVVHVTPFTVITLLYGNDNLELEENKIILTETLRLLKKLTRFDRAVFVQPTNSVVFNSHCLSFVHHPL